MGARSSVQPIVSDSTRSEEATANLPATLRIRRMTEADLLAADALWNEAFATSIDFPRADTPRTEEELRGDLDRRRHLLTNDPEGSLVACDGDRVIALAQGLRREDTYCLAMFAVAPDRQNQGVGRELLARALEYSHDCARAYIFSTSDPKALHRYVSAGFRLNPAVRVTPRASLGVTQSRDVREGTGSSDERSVIDEIDHTVRGARRPRDVEYWLASGMKLLLLEDKGYAFVTQNRLVVLAARDQHTARELFAAVLSGFPDGVARSASWIVAQQQWAIAEATRLGATLEVRGAVMTRGIQVFPEPYLPNGLFA